MCSSTQTHFDVVGGEHLPEVVERFGAGCATVVVGNPPWGNPKKSDLDGQKAMKAVKAWCSPKRGRPIGGKELSQAFLHLTGAILKEGGRAGLLVSSGVLSGTTKIAASSGECGCGPSGWSKLSTLGTFGTCSSLDRIAVQKGYRRSSRSFREGSEGVSR